MGLNARRERTMAIRLLTVVLLGLLTSGLNAAEYYTWVDENGVVNYAEKNPRNYDATHITSTRAFGRREIPRQPVAGTNSDGGSSDSDGRDSDGEGSAGIDPDEAIAAERARVAAQVAQVKQGNCDIGKRNLAQLEAFSRIRVQGEDGQERVLTDEEKQQRINEARNIIRENC